MDFGDVGYSIDSFFGKDYTPRYDKNMLNLLFQAKKQYKNTCGWVASTGAKENIDEKVILDERFLVIMGKKEGYITKDGFSNLRNNEKILQKYGCCEKGLLPTEWRSWNDYSDYNHITDHILRNAENYKSKSYSMIKHINNIYKAIDDGRSVKVGIGWRTSMNMRGGFLFPWLVSFVKGLFIGGHAIYVYGYHGSKFKCRNSFGPTYGDKGDFYVMKNDLEREMKKYGAFVNYDIEKDMLKWLISNQGNVVKTADNPGCYLIQGDKKRRYDDEATLYSHGKSDEDIVIVPNEYLDNVKEGKMIMFWEGGNVKDVKTIIKQKDHLKIIFEKYFKQLFK